MMNETTIIFELYDSTHGRIKKYIGNFPPNKYKNISRTYWLKPWTWWLFVVRHKFRKKHMKFDKKRFINVANIYYFRRNWRRRQTRKPFVKPFLSAGQDWWALVGPQSSHSEQKLEWMSGFLFREGEVSHRPHRGMELVVGTSSTVGNADDSSRCLPQQCCLNNKIIKISINTLKY